MKKIAAVILACCCTVGAFVGCGGDDDPTGTGQIQGNVDSFDNIAIVSRLLAAIEGVTVYLEGPVSRTTTTDANGNFTFTDLPPGEYTLRFEYNGEEVTYRGNSGQEATITVGDDQRIEVTDVKVSGGNVNIGNIKVVQLDEFGEPVDDGGTNDTGTVTNEVPGGIDSEPDPEPEPTPGPPTAGLVLYYPMDGNANDASGNGNHGTPNGGVTWSSDGVLGGAGSFDGVNDYIEALGSQDFDKFDRITFAAWFSSTHWRVDGYNAIINKQFQYAPGFPLFLAHNSGHMGQRGVCISTYHESVFGDGYGAWREAYSGAEVALNQWQHGVGVYDGNSLTIYLNGELKNTADVSGLNMPTNDQNVVIGGEKVGWSEWGNGSFGGLLDEVRIYNRPLSPTEVTQLYNYR